ncbi:MAG TPA: ABC transporter ATP-binding protein [Candidatus Lokiarchaeia archaeon]|nr:ABC transporter ATP-binding protein [Candidatus Lokiarchaeia archaeon]
MSRSDKNLAQDFIKGRREILEIVLFDLELSQILITIKIGSWLRISQLDITIPEQNGNSPSAVEFAPEKDRYTKARKKGPWSWILAHLFAGSNKVIISFVFLTIIVTSNLSSFTMIVIGQAVNAFIGGGAGILVNNTLLILMLSTVGPAITLVSFMMREVLAQRMERDTRREFFAILLGKSQSFYDQEKVGDLMARTVNDVRTLNFLISPAISLIFESFTALFVPTIYVIIFYPVQLIIVPVTFTVVFLLALKSYMQKIGPITWQLREEFGHLDDHLNESLSGIEVLKGCAQEKSAVEAYASIANRYRKAFVEQGNVQAKYIPILMVAVAITAGLAHGIILFFLGLLNIGQLIGFAGLLALLQFPTFISVFVFATIRLAVSGAQRLLETMNKETTIGENSEGISRQIEGKIAFEDVTFTYPGNTTPALSHVSFEINAKQTIAIIGTTGSGKTTIAKLISRLYDLDSGSIKIDGIDIKNYSLQSLRSQISHIEQDIFLFSTTFEENIAFGRTGSLEEVEAVAKLAQADEFISATPKGYQNEIGERGVQLSGGERQRVAIARAFLADPRILILDDSTSAIDSETEDKIQQAIHNIMANRTTILITHRLSQIRWADIILVMRRGDVVAQGTHEELLETSEEYRKIFVRRFDMDITKLTKLLEGGA